MIVEIIPVWWLNTFDLIGYHISPHDSLFTQCVLDFIDGHRLDLFQKSGDLFRLAGPGFTGDQCARRFGDSAGFKEDMQRNLYLESFLYARLQPRGHKGMAAEVEEVIIDADSLKSE